AAPAAGALALSLASGWTRHVVRHGRAVAIAAAGWGAAIVVFGVAGPLWLAIAALAVAGASDAVSAIFRGTIWNEVVPDRMRGRLAGMEMISYTAGPTLGNVEAGFAAALAGALPELWRYESEAMRRPAGTHRAVESSGSG